MKKNVKGYVSFVLHAHLPFVHHPESEDYLEEQWLYEAISETYIPLLLNFQKLVDEKVDFRFTMSLTPPLLNMLDNEMLQQRYIKYLEKHIELAEKEIVRTKDNLRINKLSHYYYDRYSNDLHVFRDIYKCNLISGFKKFNDLGVLEIIGCGATHGYFPILYVNEKTVRAQIALGVQTYNKYFDKPIKGFWLPECGYVPEADKYLREFGVQYVLVETHGILYADPTPLYGTYAPIVSPNGVVAFGRDLESSRQVWSSINGYPGDFNYREFYRDIGYDAPYDYIKNKRFENFNLELLVKQRIKIFMIYNGLRTLLKNKQDISLIVDVNRLTIYLSILITHQLLYVLMMLNYMVIGGMKVLTGYILLLKKCIMINVILH